jgi:hypothetical protein
VGAAYTGTPYSMVSGACTAVQGSGTDYFTITPFAVTGFEGATTMGGAGPFAGYTSGSRIQLTAIHASDGARTIGLWHDAQLGNDCYFTTAVDGVVRCLPYPLAYVYPYYSDATCQTPLVLAYSCGGVVPRYAEDLSSCASSYYLVGSAYSGPVYTSSGTSCVTTSLSLPTYQRGAALPASTFASATLSH